ncbi:hypothetical protein, partial [Treponema sp.]|uniref:hypothetical protein n=1 Tax=Treponema sp. TaxID=166 RepID=UPI00388F1448
MKLLKKLIVSALVFAGALSASFAVDLSAVTTSDIPYLSEINSGMEDFAEQLGFSVPQAAVQQNVYADAFIGKLFPAVPPHFAVGFNTGFTHLNTSGLAKAAGKLGIDGVNDNYYFPVLNADVRIGGVFLPFDIGISFMTLDVSNFNTMDADFSAEYFTLAFDARYAILEDGLICPGLSIGAGYSMNKGSFGASSSYAEVNVDYDVQTLYGQLQLSKAINIPVVRIGFTPFVGLRGVISKYSNDWSWKVKNSLAASAVDALPIKTSGTSDSDG